MVYLTVVLKSNTGEYILEEFKNLEFLNEYLKTVSETPDVQLISQTEQTYLQ